MDDVRSRGSSLPSPDAASHGRSRPRRPVAAGCGGTDTSGDDTFAYDEDAPLAVEAGARVERTIRSSSGRSRTRAATVASRAISRRRREATVAFPAVVYLHGSGGDRSQLLPLAEWLAARGAVALTLTLPSGSATPPAGLTPEETLRWQRDTIVADVVAVRRAFDILAADERVDPDRLGLVGWSFGGRLGAIVAGVDDRVDATALMSAGAAPVSEYVAAAPADLRDDVEDVLTPIDPLIADRRGEGRRPPAGRPLRLGRARASAPGARGRRARRRRASAGTTPSTTSTTAPGASSSTWLTERLGIDGPVGWAAPP